MYNLRTAVRFFVCASALLFVVSGTDALAATLSVAPSAYTVTAGDVVRVRVVVNSGGDAINTSEGVLQFPADVLDVVSVDKSASIFSIWVDEPTFSNQLGTVSFSGGLPSPGFTGVSGTVINVVFHAKRAGTASLSLSGATVRANDGLGTDVLQGASGTTLTVTQPKVVVPTPTPTPVPKVQPTTPTTPVPAQTDVASTTPTTTASVGTQVEPEPQTPANPLAETVTFSLGEFNVNIMTLLIMMFFLTLGSFIAACLAWWRLYTYHAPRGHVSKKVIADIHRALTLFKEDMTDHLNALDAAKTKRELTEEEITMKADMKTNFAVLEKYIEDELS